MNCFNAFAHGERSKNQDEHSNITVIKEINHTYQYHTENTTIEPCLSYEYPNEVRAMPNELVIIDYPYECKRPTLPCLFLEKPQVPLKTQPVLPYLSIDPPKDALSNNNETNLMNLTLNEQCKEGNNNDNESDIIQLKTENSYVTTKASKCKEISPIFANKTESLTSTIQHCNTHKPKCDIRTLLSHRQQVARGPIVIKKDLNTYCIYCEEIYKHCVLNNTTLPANKTCINCDKVISNELLELYKRNASIEQYGNIAKTTRNKGFNHPQLEPRSIVKTLTQAKAKEAGYKRLKLDSSVNNSHNSSFVKEKELFKKKYSFLQMHNHSAKSIKASKDKTVSKASTVKESISLGYDMKRHCPMKLTMAFGDETKCLSKR